MGVKYWIPALASLGRDDTGDSTFFGSRSLDVVVPEAAQRLSGTQTPSGSDVRQRIGPVM